MNHIRRGAGKPLLLVHGLGGSWRSWNPILDALCAAGREVVAVDLPGHGLTPKLEGENSVGKLADALTRFLAAQNLTGVDAVGSSMGARLVLELARRGGGVLGAVVSLDPGGFWRGWERHYLYATLYASVRLVRGLQPAMPFIAGNPLTRTMLLPQLSARPWKLAPQLVLDEMRGFAASTSFDELLHQLAYGEDQAGAPPGTIRRPLVIGWGRRDRVCLPRQAARALELFPDARKHMPRDKPIHWFEHCGHFPHWDAPQETTRLILETTSTDS